MYRFLIISCFLFLFSCSSEPTSTGVAIDLFDTEAYLLEEFEGISQKNITKTISYNDSEEVMEIKDYNLEGDLEVLKTTNINNPSWTDRYTVDTLKENAGRIDIVYASVDPKLKIKKLTVFRQNDHIIGFESFQENYALISSSSKRITYISKKGYEIVSISENLISPERRVSIDVKF